MCTVRGDKGTSVLAAFFLTLVNRLQVEQKIQKKANVLIMVISCTHRKWKITFP